VELDEGDTYAYRYLFGLEVRVLVRGDVKDQRAAALAAAERAREELGVEGKVRVAFAPR